MRKPVKLTRYDGNPILRPAPEHGFEAQNVSNAAAIVHEGRVHLLYRSEGFEDRWPNTKTWPKTYLGLATSKDGYHIDERLDRPVIGPEPAGEYGCWGIQDPRLVKIGEAFYATTAGVSPWGDRVILYTSKDLRSWEKRALIKPEHEMRTAGMFPEKFGDDYCFLLRPDPNMWIGYTPDFVHWHGYKLMFEIKRGSWYGRKLGLGAPPIRQDDAWLLFWHGKADTQDGTYSLGVMWLDLEDPGRIIRFQEEPILRAELEWERFGYYPNVAYTCGAVQLGDRYLVYYGAADRVLAVASVPVADCRL